MSEIDWSALFALVQRQPTREQERRHIETMRALEQRAIERVRQEMRENHDPGDEDRSER